MSEIRKFFSKLNSMPPALKASFWFVVSNVALKGISFITTPIFTRMLEVSDYGTTSIFVTWEGIINIFATLNLAGGVYNVAMTKYPDDIDNYTLCMFSLEAVLSSVVYALTIAFNYAFPQVLNLSNIFLVFMWLQTLTNAFITFWLMRLRFNFEYKPVIAFTLSNAILSPCIAILLISLFPDNAAMAKVVGSGAFGLVFGMVIMIHVVRKGKRFYSREYWRFALKFNIPLLPHYLSGILLNGVDRIMIDRMVNRAAAGIYSISHSISGTLSLVTNAVNSTMIPLTLQSIRSRNFEGLKKSIAGYGAIISFICICIMMVGKEAVLIIASAKYVEAIPYVPPLLVSVYLTFVSGIVGNILFYYEKTWSMSFTTITCAVLNLVLNYFGIKYIGAIAACYTTLISSLVGVIMQYFFVSQCEKQIKDIIDIRLIGLMFMVLIGYGIVAIMFENNFLIRMVFVSFPPLIAFTNRRSIFKLLKKRI